MISSSKPATQYGCFLEPLELLFPEAIPTLRFSFVQFKVERVTRFERATSSLARKCSTTELHPRCAWGPLC